MRFPAYVLVLAWLVAGGPGASPWEWPLAGHPAVIRRFDPPAQRWLAGHRGVDLAARPEEEVHAAGPGTVGHARRIAGRGVVTIVHADGLRTTYLPVQASVRPGDSVAAGDVIGVVEDSGAHCGAPCLHWGLLRGDLYLDPLLLFGLGQVRLMPLWSDPSSGPAHSPRPSGTPPSADFREQKLDPAPAPAVAAASRQDGGPPAEQGDAAAPTLRLVGAGTGIGLGLWALMALCTARAVIIPFRRRR